MLSHRWVQNSPQCELSHSRARAAGANLDAGRRYERPGTLMMTALLRALSRTRLDVSVLDLAWLALAAFIVVMSMWVFKG